MGRAIAVAGDLIHRLHGKFFKHLTREKFDEIHYSGLRSNKYGDDIPERSLDGCSIVDVGSLIGGVLLMSQISEIKPESFEPRQAISRHRFQWTNRLEFSNGNFTDFGIRLPNAPGYG